MPLQDPFDPLFALVAVPAEYAAAAGGVLVTAIAAQWKAYRADDQRGRDELRKALETVHDTTATVAALIATIKDGDSESRRFKDAVLARLDAIESKMERTHREAG